MSITTGQFEMAIDQLREDIKERDERQTKNIETLAVKTETWQDEVRHEFSEVKNRLTIIETQTATTEKAKSWGWERWTTLSVILVAAIECVVEWAHK
jgi:hypothetical protein